MITEQDLREAIAECEGARRPNADTCIKLAAFYTIRQNMYGNKDDAPVKQQHSFSQSPDVKTETIIDYEGESEFSQLIAGKDSWGVWEIMDELMGTLQVINPRLYDGVMRKIAE